MQLARVNFKLLHVFVAVAENTSFRQASELLHRSPSAVSMQIKQLEEQIGVPLFHRTTRQVLLTREGEELLIFAQRALTEWDNGLRQIREAADIQRGTIAFGCMPTVAGALLPAIVSQFAAAYPGIKITLREAPAEQLLESLRRREVDLAIGPQIEGLAEFQFDAMLKEPIFAVGLPKYFPPRATSIDLETLVGLPIVFSSRSAALTANLEQALASRNLHLNVRYELYHHQTMLAFARAGLGVAILPRIAFQSGQRGPMRGLPIVQPALMRTLCIITQRGQSLSPAALSFREIAQDVLKSAASDNPRIKASRS